VLRRSRMLFSHSLCESALRHAAHVPSATNKRSLLRRSSASGQRAAFFLPCDGDTPSFFSIQSSKNPLALPLLLFRRTVRAVTTYQRPRTLFRDRIRERRLFLFLLIVFFFFFLSFPPLWRGDNDAFRIRVTRPAPPFSFARQGIFFSFLPVRLQSRDSFFLFYWIERRLAQYRGLVDERERRNVFFVSRRIAADSFLA